MKRKLLYSAGMLMALASPIFAQTPAAGGGGSDLKLPAAYLAMGIASGLWSGPSRCWTSTTGRPARR